MSDNGDMSDKERYQRYLAGREWGLLKQQVKARSGGICERCKFIPSTAVHHITYARKYNERIEDLQDLCDDCHKYVHGLSNSDPINCLKSCELLGEIHGRRGALAAFTFVLGELTERPQTLRKYVESVMEQLANEVEELRHEYESIMEQR